MSNISFNPFNLSATPNSGALSIGTNVPLISFRRFDSTFLSASQMDLGSISVEYTAISSGSSADLVFKASSPERSGSKSTEVLRVSSTGSTNDPRLGIGDFSNSDIESTLHIKGNTKVDGGRLILSADSESDIVITKRDLELLLDGKPVDQTSTTKRGITRTNTTNALVSLADDNTLIKTNQSGILDFEVSGSTALKLEKTGKAPKVMITGSTEVSGSFTVNDLLTVLADYGQTGSFSVSGSTTLNGDVNLDGQVNVNDLLEVLAGFNASGSNTITGSMEITGSRFSRRSRSQQNATGSAALRVGGGFIAMGNPPPPDEGGETFDWPYNPDSNGNGVIEVNDILAILSIYGQDFEVAFEVSENGLLCDGDTHISGNLFHGYCEPCDEDGHNTITGIFNHAHGYNNTITGDFSFARGRDNTVTGNYGFLMGQNLTTTTEYQTVLGKQNAANGNALFIIGKGSSTNALEIETDKTTFTTPKFFLEDLEGVGTIQSTDDRHALVIDTNGKVVRSDVNLVGSGDFQFIPGVGGAYLASGDGAQGTFRITVDTGTVGGSYSQIVQTGLTTTSNVIFSNLTATGDTVKFTGIPDSPSITTPLVIDSAGKIYTGSAYALASGGGGGSGTFSGLSASADTGGQFNLPAGSVLTIAGGSNIVTSNPAGTQIQIDLTGGILSSSAQIATEISGTADAVTSSLLNSYTFISSSTQIADAISGSFTSISSSLSSSIANLIVNSSSFATDINNNTTNISTNATDIDALQVSSSAGIRLQDGDSGFSVAPLETASFVAAGGNGLTVNVDSNNITYTLAGVLSSSQQIATDISGAIVAATSSILSDYGLISSSDQLTLTDDDWFIGSTFLTSSRMVRITASLTNGRGVSATGEFSHAEGNATFAQGKFTHAEGERTYAIGPLSHAEGQGSQAIGSGSHAEGASFAYGSGSHAEGYLTVASGGFAHSEGYYTIASGAYSHAEGYQTTASAQGSHAEGFQTEVSPAATYGHAEGYGTLVTGQAAHAEGSNTLASGDLSHAEGRQATSSGDYSHAQGRNSHAQGNYSFAAGIKSVAEGAYSFAIGDNTHTGGAYSFAAGQKVSSSGAHSFAHGQSTKTKSSYSHAEGYLTSASGTHSHAEGDRTTTLGQKSHAEGSLTIASGISSHAEGYNTLASGAYSHAEGSNTHASGAYSHAEGSSSLALGVASHAQGYLNTASGDYSFAAGGFNTASAKHSFAIGVRNSVDAQHSFVGGFRNTIGGNNSENEYSFVHGSDNVIKPIGNKGVAIFGSSNTAENASAGSFLLGSTNTVKASGGNFVQGQNNIVENGSNNHFEGAFNTGSNAVKSHAEGQENTISGSGGGLGETIIGAHVEGYKNTAENNPLFGSAKFAHAEGTECVVYGNFSHAEGKRSYAYGSGSHAEGYGGIAYGDYSHAQGTTTIASGSYSFASGINTISAGTGSATFGKYNIADTNSGSLLIIGNGTSTGDRRNLATFNSQSILLDTASLPTSDPTNVGQLWRDGTTLKISLG